MRFAAGLFCGLVFPFLAHSCTAREVTVGVSPYDEPMQVRQTIIQTLQQVIEMEPGDRFTFIDAWDQQTIATLVIPEGRAYAAPKARLAYNGRAVKALMRFAEQARMPVGANEPAMRGAVRTPQFLAHVRRTAPTEEPLDIILYGSPFYDDRRDAAVSMATGLIPSDGHINSSRADTPFGTKGATAPAHPVRIHWALDPATQWQSDQHRYFVERFWTLYTRALGLQLASFTRDRATVLSRAKGSATPSSPSFTLEDGEKREMIRLRPQTIPQTLYDTAVSEQSAPVDTLRAARNVEVGLSWDCARCDLDIYARPHAQAAVLYFGNNTSPEGNHWKDHVSAPRGGREHGPVNGYETISFTVPVDLHQLQIVVSFYSGRARNGVVGELRLAANGQVYAHDIRLPATRGAKAAGVVEAFENGRSDDPHIVMVDPLAVLGVDRGAL